LGPDKELFEAVVGWPAGHDYGLSFTTSLSRKAALSTFLSCSDLSTDRIFAARRTGLRAVPQQLGTDHQRSAPGFRLCPKIHQMIVILGIENGQSPDGELMMLTGNIHQPD
jgi:hypothetical protein